MSKSQIFLAAEAAEAVQLRRAQAVIGQPGPGGQPQPPPLPPECRPYPGTMMMSNPEACLLARARARSDATLGDRAEMLQHLLPVSQSLDLDLPRLPAAPLERLNALQNLGDKYSAAARFLSRYSESAGGSARRDNALLDLAQSFLGKQDAVFRELMATPDIKQAWIEEKLPSHIVPSDFLERIEWGADRLTYRLKRSLQADFGSKVLFADRQEDLSQSARERDQAADHARWGEPTENEIGLAVLRVFSSTGGRLTSAIESERSGPTTLLAVVLNAPITDVNRVVHVQKMQPCKKAGGDWTCTVRIWLHVFQRGNGMRVFQGAQAAPMVKLILAAREEAARLNGTPEDMVLRATANGWTAPALVQKVLESDAAKMRAMDDAARMARCSTRPPFAPRWVYFDPSCMR